MNTTPRFLMVSIFALTLTACASSGPRYTDSGYNNSRGYSNVNRNDYARCYDCGTVERIERTYGERTSSGGGAILGGIVGGVLGNQVGSGSGRKAATVAGAIAGGVAGNNIEKNNNSAQMYELFLRMDDGRRIVLSQRDLRGIREGSRIQVRGNSARLY